MQKNTISSSSFRPEEKKIMGILSTGTFLEYFDLMLYVHMAFLLNDLFLPNNNDEEYELLKLDWQVIVSMIGLRYFNLYHP